jgi:hypothetical protein
MMSAWPASWRVQETPPDGSAPKKSVESVKSVAAFSVSDHRAKQLPKADSDSDSDRDPDNCQPERHTLFMQHGSDHLLKDQLMPVVKP